MGRKKVDLNNENNNNENNNIETNEKVLNLRDIAKGLFTVNDMISVLSDTIDEIKISDWIHTGNYLLNAQISGSLFKGIPSGRITMIVGESGTGKTFLTLNILRNAQKMGYNVILIDTESAIDDSTLMRFKFDLDKILYVPIVTIKELTSFLLNFAEMLVKYKNENTNIGKYIIAIDSLGNLATDKEIEDIIEGEDKADMTRAREMKKLFRVCTQKLSRLGIPIIVTNHIYSAIGGYTTTNIVSGGKGPFYNSSVILSLKKNVIKDSNNNKTGISVFSEIIKSRFTKNFLSIKFDISHMGGMNPYKGLEDYISWDICGIGFGKIEKRNNEIVYVPSNQKRFIAVKHLGKTLPANKLFTPEVFTDEVLNSLEPIISNKFMLPFIDNEYVDAEEFFE